MIYFLIYLFLEVYVSVEIASLLGPFWTFVEIVATAVYGIWVLKNMHIQLLSTMQSMAQGEITLEEFEAMNLYTVVGAILLIIPGFLSDIIGILLQFGVLSKFLATKIFRLKKERRFDEEDIIDVEIIER